MLLPSTNASIVARRAEIVAALKDIVPDGVVADPSGLATFDSDALSALSGGSRPRGLRVAIKFRKML